KSIDWLTSQGRMHPEIAEFTNHYFYQDRLTCLNLPHQKEIVRPIVRLSIRPKEEVQDLEGRVTFIEADYEDCPESYKINHSEAAIAAHIAHQVYEQLHDSFDANKTLGIITPYRSQIA